MPVGAQNPRNTSLPLAISATAAAATAAVETAEGRNASSDD